MARALEFLATIKNGAILPPYDLGAFMRQRDGAQVKVNLSLNTKQRSTKQNRHYWGVCIPLVLEIFKGSGNDMDGEDVHCFLKEHVGGITELVHLPDGNRRTLIKSSKKLTTTEWMEYLTKIQAWAAQYGFNIPSPGEA